MPQWDGELLDPQSYPWGLINKGTGLLLNMLDCHWLHEVFISSQYIWVFMFQNPELRSQVLRASIPFYFMLFYVNYDCRIKTACNSRKLSKHHSNISNRGSYPLFFWFVIYIYWNLVDPNTNGYIFLRIFKNFFFQMSSTTFGHIVKVACPRVPSILNN